MIVMRSTTQTPQPDPGSSTSRNVLRQVAVRCNKVTCVILLQTKIDKPKEVSHTSYSTQGETLRGDLNAYGLAVAYKYALVREVTRWRQAGQLDSSRPQSWHTRWPQPRNTFLGFSMHTTHSVASALSSTAARAASDLCLSITCFRSSTSPFSCSSRKRCKV